MKIWHISDTHTYHNLLEIPNDIDVVIHSGDCSNPRDAYQNKVEVENFIEWYSKINIPIKIFIPGNHDTSIEKGLANKNDFTCKDIIFLNNSDVIYKDIKFWGTPYTPSFGVGWAYNKQRHKMHDLWQSVPEDVNVLISHGPPKGILDLSYNQANELEFCGCNAMKKHVQNKQYDAVLFGHIHNCQDIVNAGIMQLSGLKTVFSNGSVVTDGKFGSLSSNGNIIII
tara:strand:- start:18021 stop:18698 length:678 start_codon:yes stop_codon:yes gene_type:complete